MRLAGSVRHDLVSRCAVTLGALLLLRARSRLHRESGRNHPDEGPVK